MKIKKLFEFITNPTFSDAPGVRTALGLGNVDNTADADKPVSATQQAAINARQLTTEKGQADGYAGLDAGGKVPSAQLPAIALTETFEVADEAARLALTSAQAEGKIIVQIDTGKSYGLPTGNDPSVNGDWVILGDRDISMADVVGLVAALAAKQAILAEGAFVDGDKAKLNTLTPFELHDVADNDAKLALTGIDPGYKVRVTGEAGRIEVYLGALNATLGIAVAGAGASAANGDYIPDGESFGKQQFTLVGGTTNDDSIHWDGLMWIMSSGGSNIYYSNDDVATPDLVTTWNNLSGVLPLPTVTAISVPEANDDNWLIVGPNTFEVFVLDEAGEVFTINDISIPRGIWTSVGWHRQGELLPGGDGASLGLVSFGSPTSGAIWNAGFSVYNEGGSGLPLPTPIPARGSAYLQIVAF